MITPQPLLEVENICKAFGGVPVLKGVSLALATGRVLGLVGENGAGKSTLMNVLGGNVRAESGVMRWQGRLYAPRDAQDARRAGIAFVHQELDLFPNLTVAENLFLTGFPRRRRWPWIDRAELHRRARGLLEAVGLSLAPTDKLERLSAGERQLVEIARALGQEARLLILDEPTTSLGAREAGVLFRLVGQLRERGVSVVYISHALGDVLRLCDEVAVLRDGELVAGGQVKEFTVDRMVSLMVGRSVQRLFPQRRGAATAEPLLVVNGLSQPGVVRDIRFTLHRGEVLGVFGLMGAGRSELARMLFGLDAWRTGSLYLDRVDLGACGVRRRIRRGLALVTEDRRSDGLCREASITDNLALVTLREHARGPLGWLKVSAMKAAVEGIRSAVRLTETARGERPVRTLSGGNQQKVVLGKWLLAKPRVLILDEPTRGIDVGARHEIYQLVLELADAGTGLLLISSELEELMGLCDRILVMNQGELRCAVARDSFDREGILRAALRDDAVSSEASGRADAAGKSS